MSRKVGLIIAFVALAVVLGLMGSHYFQTTAEYRALHDRHVLAQARLPGLISEKADLEGQEAQARSVLETSRAKFPESIESIEYGEDICRTAVEFGLKVIDLATWPPRDRTVHGISYPIAAYRVVVGGGTVSGILDFLDAIRNPGDFQLPWSAEIYEVEINYETGQAKISFEIFGYRR